MIAIAGNLSPPGGIAAQILTMAKNRMLVELIENGIEAQERKQRMVFGD